MYKYNYNYFNFRVKFQVNVIFLFCTDKNILVLLFINHCFYWVDNKIYHLVVRKLFNKGYL